MSDAINWQDLPPIQDDLDRLKRLREHPETNDHPSINIGEWFREPGKEYLLRVKVTDVDLAQVVLTRAFSNESRIPGMEVTELNLDPDADRNRSTVQLLRELADRLEMEELNGC